ncbi:MAG: hypothetical protein ACYTGR_03705, partial [Planctomycetota bacterium]
DLAVVDTTFPHDKPQMLYWTIDSEMAGKATVEISYFTSGISWAADYVCTANTNETELGLEGFVRVINGSGEDYADAQVRLVVGEINLVEMVAELARRGLVSADDARELQMRGRAADMPSPSRRVVMEGLAADMDMAGMSQKQITKQGLSEYFIYTIPGTETVANGWSKRMRLFNGERVPIEIAYRYREPEYGRQLVRLFLIRNDEASSLGSTPLPNGMVRVFRDNGREGLSFLAAHPTRYIPIGQRIELNLGVDPLVTHARVQVRRWRDNFWFHDSRGRKYVSPTRDRVIRDDAPIAGWDDHGQWEERIRNFRDRPIAVEIRRDLDGDVSLQTDAEVALHDYRTPQLTVTVAADSTHAIGYELLRREGINAKQNRVTLD